MAGKPCRPENICIGSDLLCSTELICECESMYANKTGQCVQNPLNGKYNTESRVVEIEHCIIHVLNTSKRTAHDQNI